MSQRCSELSDPPLFFRSPLSSSGVVSLSQALCSSDDYSNSLLHLDLSKNPGVLSGEDATVSATDDLESRSRITDTVFPNRKSALFCNLHKYVNLMSLRDTCIDVFSLFCMIHLFPFREHLSIYFTSE